MSSSAEGGQARTINPIFVYTTAPHYLPGPADSIAVHRIDRTLVSPHGEAWVERMMPAGAPRRVEVFNDRGILVGSMELPPRAKVVGFGGGDEPASAAYVARTDDVGLVWLECYRLLRIASRD